MTTSNAQGRRLILANAHAAWFATADKKAAKLALKAALVETNIIERTDHIAVRMDSTTIEILVEVDGDLLEVLSLDAYGNIIRGQD